jgi:DNA-binding NarL/FixJ family response regulator
MLVSRYAKPESVTPHLTKHEEMKQTTILMKQQRLDWRRVQVLELASEGYSQREIANKHHVDLAPVNRDIQYLLKLITSTFFNPSIIVIF